MYLLMRKDMIAPRYGSVHAQREDISLHQDEMNLNMRKERILHCDKRRCTYLLMRKYCRGYSIAPRGDVPEHAQREDISLRQEEMFQRMRKRAYFIVVRGDVSVHALGKFISLCQEEMFLLMHQKVFHCAKRRCFSICQREDTVFHCAKVRCFSTCAREDIKLCQSKDVFAREQERIFQCAKRRCFSTCAKRGLREEEMYLLMRKERIFQCAKSKCFCACAKRGYFIAPRGDGSAHAQREDISLHLEEMYLRTCKERIFHAPRGNVSAHVQREDISLRQE
jgi:hypothetical protein